LKGKYIEKIVCSDQHIEKQKARSLPNVKLSPQVTPYFLLGGWVAPIYKHNTETDFDAPVLLKDSFNFNQVLTFGTSWSSRIDVSLSFTIETKSDPRPECSPTNIKTLGIHPV
jgi:hypothetical protein